ncbi:RagB/SusD family nutrient uptake outer membrane protein [Chitinophaga sp. GCM10012297]|uniref:RagB/SusD family nutrient uptake outer membrane protein n=1 Tax=Chitinophaga chungangae TaxID=2821488 RepID=A0ABS3YAW1_9BACT|nr:RagB/SusD family nutrient uptake outer membrane protein [Chitinophaga chungangae]MBO9151822.1 RagB/SusD family nutrient uptake outer membrane protein [Chitinophaga chungangae]
MQKILLAAGSALLLMTASCNKSLLETSPNDRYQESTYWNSPDAAAAGLVGCYSVLRNDGLYGGKGSNNATALWDETLSPNAWNYSNSYSFNSIAMGEHNASTGGVVTGRWGDSYGGIGRCNTLLAKIDEVPGMDPADTKRMKGEAYFLRALYYFTLATYYGGAPLILTPPDEKADSDVPRSTREEVIAQVLADLESAITSLPNKATEPGRASKGAAMALKARVLLYEASPLMTGGTNSQAKWQAAADAAKAVITSANSFGYKLDTNYRKMFLPQFENNAEVIFDVQYIFPLQGNSFDLICRQYNTNAPLQDLVDAYLMKNGLPRTAPGSGYSEANMWKDRDPRMYATLTFPGDKYMGKVVANNRFSFTGYGMKKFSIYDTAAAPKDKESLVGGQSETNFIVLRYADVLLMYAEAQNEATGPDNTVYAALDSIRSRVKMPFITPGLSQAQMRDVIRLERRIELAGEGLYYNDIRRWKTAETVMNTDIYNYKRERQATRSFDATRDYWWPIPTGERDLNPNLEQNPFY